MRKQCLLMIGLAAAAAWPGAVLAQQTDFLTVKKVACAPDRMTRCKEVGVDCETRPASERDKAQILVIDFAMKKALIRRNNEDRPFGDVTEDKVEGETRRVVIARGQGGEDTLAITLKKDGKMEGVRDRGRIKMEAACTASP